MKLIKSEKKGLTGTGLIYLITGIVILGLIAINVAINLIWLGPFSAKLRQRAIKQEITEAKRASESIEKSIIVEISGIIRLSQDIVETENPQFFISRFLKENPNIKEISVIGLDGREKKRYSREKYFIKETLRDFSFLEEFEKPKQGQTFISNVNFTEKAEPYIKITAPIRKSGTEQTEGVLRAVFYLKGMWEKVLEIKIGETGRVLVIDNKGMLIAGPKPSRVLKKTNLLIFPPANPLIMGKIFEGAEYLNEKGIKVIGVGAPIKKLKWGVIVEQDVAEVEALSREVKTFTSLFLITGLIVVWFLVLLILIIKKADQNLARQGSALKAKTEELEEAKSVLEIRVQARTRELKELADMFEERAGEKTRELQEKVEELEKFQKLAVGRELKMVELKKEIKELKALKDK